MLIGFDKIAEKLKLLHAQNRLHHAILFNGKNGIGKASFAKNFALEILQKIGESEEHPDLLMIQKDVEKKEISVEKIRQISKFFNQTSAVSKNKIVIIDSVDELNKSSSNALLKVLEEPNNNNFLFLISHSLTKSLPTIRSRCQIVKINDLVFADFAKILKEEIAEISDEQIKILSEICGNSPAKAINFGQDLSWIYEHLLTSFNEKILHEELLKKISDKKFEFENFTEIAEFFFLRFMKYLNGKTEFFIFDEKEVFQKLKNDFSLDQIFAIHDEGLNLLNKTASMSLDKKLSVINFFNLFYA